MDEREDVLRDWEPRYHEAVFHVFDIDGLQIEKLWVTAPKYCCDDGFSGEIKVSEDEPEEVESDEVVETSVSDSVSIGASENAHDIKVEEGATDCKSFTTVLNYASTQGVSVVYYSNEQAHLHIELPWLASIGDVKLAFAYMHALRELYPDCVILYDENREQQFALAPENFDAMVVSRLQNLMQLVELFDDKQHMQVQGVNRAFFVPTKVDYPDMDTFDLAMKAMNMFIEVQWKYQDCDTASLIEMTHGQTGETFTARMLLNLEDAFVGVSRKVTLMNDTNAVKIVDIQEFLDKTKDNKYVEMVDPVQFILRKMPDAVWRQLYDSLDGEECMDSNNPVARTYLLRWNPSISSFTAKDYEDSVAKYPEAFQMDWSIYEWEEAHEGDRYYMLRVGGEADGIVFQGEFLSDPYVDKDWAGTDRQRHYVGICCYDLSAPHGRPLVTAEELEAVLPEIDWHRGHSGVLLTPEQAAAIDELIAATLG